jgi:hypothetical protein
VDLSRLTFLSHFVLCLACAGLAFFARANGVPQSIWTNDMSIMTSVIGALFVGSSIWLGWGAWRIGDPTSDERGRPDPGPFLLFFHRLIMVIWQSDFVSWQVLSARRSAFLCRLSRSPAA